MLFEITASAVLREALAKMDFLQSQATQIKKIEDLHIRLAAHPHHITCDFKVDVAPGEINYHLTPANKQGFQEILKAFALLGGKRTITGMRCSIVEFGEVYPSIWLHMPEDEL